MSLIDNLSASALNTLLRVRGGTFAIIDGINVANAYLTQDARSTDPTMGGMISGASQSILVLKTDYPDRPPENCSVIFPTGELAGSDLIAAEVSDRGGYWSIVCEESIN